MQTQAVNSRLGKFLVAAVLFLAWGVIQGALQAQRPIHDFISQGPADIIVGAHAHVNLVGWVSLMVAPIIYYLLPIVSGKQIAAPRLIDWIFWVWVVSLLVNAALMITAGIVGGNAFIAGTKGPQLDAILGPYMMLIGIFSIIWALVLLVFIAQILVSASRKAAPAKQG